MYEFVDEIKTLHRAVVEARVAAPGVDLVAWLRSERARERALPEARAAAQLTAKRAAELLPGAPDARLDRIDLSVTADEEGLKLRVEVGAFGRAGVEGHALAAASLAATALCLALHERAPSAHLAHLGLLRVRRGDRISDRSQRPLGAELILVSDAILAGQKEDLITPAVLQALTSAGAELGEAEVLATDEGKVRARLARALDRGTPLVLLAGGTGLLPGDRTPELLTALAEARGGRRIPGIEEAMRSYGLERSLRATISRSAAFQVGASVVLALPGSSRGARESLKAVLPAALYLARKLRALP